MAKQKPLWTAIDADNLKSALGMYSEAASDMMDITQVVQKGMCDPSFDVSLRDISRLSVALRAGSELLQALLSAKELIEQREENARLRKAAEGK